MKLGANLIHGPGDKVSAFAARAEELGVHSLWRGEAYAGDAVTAIAWAAAQTSRIVLGSAVMQMAARTPAMTAMTALSLQELTGGRFICGIGMSGPQVVEGWHGVPYTPPLRTTREYVAIMRAIFRAEAAVSFDGDVFQLPYRGDGATGLGKALRPRTSAAPELPVYVAAIGPKNVALATEIADGLLPILWNPYRVAEGFGDALARAQAGVRDRGDGSGGGRPGRGVVPGQGPPVDRRVRRRDGRTVPQLLQRSRPPLRLRRGGRERAGSVPVRAARRSGVAGPGRARRRAGGGRRPGAHRRQPGRLEGIGRGHDHHRLAHRREHAADGRAPGLTLR